MNRIATFIALTLTLLLLCSCGSVVKGYANKHLTEKKGAIPPALGKEKSTIVFITHHDSYNRYLEKNVKEYYTGKYEFVSEEKFETEDKYRDLDKYRFIFDYNDNPEETMWESMNIQSDSTITNSKERPDVYNVKRFAIADRKEEKIYVSNITSNFSSALQKVYLKKMSEKIIAEATTPQKEVETQTAMLYIKE